MKNIPNYFRLLCLTGGLFWTGCVPRPEVVAPRTPSKAPLDYERDLFPVLADYCYECHGDGVDKGDLALDAYESLDLIAAHPQVFDGVILQLRTHLMPPPDEPQPALAARRALADQLEQLVYPVDCRQPDPGHITLRRLNRQEFGHSLEDLFGMTLPEAFTLPPDDTGYGFDTVGDTLTLSPLFLEHVIGIHGEVLDAVFDPAPAAQHQRVPGRDFQGGRVLGDAAQLWSNGTLSRQFTLTQAGRFRLQARLSADQAGDEQPRIRIRWKDTVLGEWNLSVEQPDTEVVEIEWTVEQPGSGRLAVDFLNDFYQPDHPNPGQRDRNIHLNQVEVAGPLAESPHDRAAGYRRWITRQPEADESWGVVSAELLRPFLRRAWRRPPAEEDIRRLVGLVHLAREEGDTFDGAMRLAMQAALSSPRFLYREPVYADAESPAATAGVIDEYRLASRLAFFLWSTGPDEELLDLAGQGQLRHALPAQIERMVADPRIERFVRNFGGQWLRLRNLDLVEPDPVAFPGFDPGLLPAMREETERFLLHVVRTDRPVTDLLQADYSFMNPALARHYGLPGIEGEGFQQVTLTNSWRGGVLTHASILTLTSNPGRTSPVKRGQFILENLIGMAPPPAPPFVPGLDETAPVEEGGSLRERLSRHSTDPDCASCHTLMDPLGFAFEHYDALGRWRPDDSGAPIDPSGKWITGQAFADSRELQGLLAAVHPDDFVRCLAEKLLVYALGRGPIPDDRCTLDAIGERSRREGYRFSAVLAGLIESVPFQQAPVLPAARQEVASGSPSPHSSVSE